MAAHAFFEASRYIGDPQKQGEKENIMNRRGFFSFLAAAPVGVAAGLTVKPAAAEIAPSVLRSSSEYQCGCGSHIHHFIPVPESRFSMQGPMRGQAICAWCKAPWGGPTS